MLNGLRALGRALLLWVLRWFPTATQASVSGTVQSVLVIRTDDRVGNVLLTTPLLVALRKALPDARLGFLCAARLAPLVEGTGLYDELWPFEKRDFFLHPIRFWRALWRLRRARYELAIDAGHFHVFSFTSGALAVLSGARIRIGHDRGDARHLLTHVVRKDPAIVYDAAAKLELLRPLRFSLETPHLRTEMGRKEEARMKALFGAGRVVVLNPGARKADHRWSPEAFAAVANKLYADLGLRVWVAWGPGEEVLAREVVRLSHSSLLPPTDLEGLAGAFRAAALVVTNDTGPMHLAIAVGAPTIAVALSHDIARWCLEGPSTAVVRSDPEASGNAVAEIVEAARRLIAPRRLTGPTVAP